MKKSFSMTWSSAVVGFAMLFAVQSNATIATGRNFLESKYNCAKSMIYNQLKITEFNDLVILDMQLYLGNQDSVTFVARDKDNNRFTGEIRLNFTEFVSEKNRNGQEIEGTANSVVCEYPESGNDFILKNIKGTTIFRR